MYTGLFGRLFGQGVKDVVETAVGVSTTSASDSVTKQGSLSYLRQLMDWDTIAVETDIIDPFGKDIDKTHKAIKMAEAGASTGEIIVVIEEDIDVDVYLTKRVQNLAKALEEMKKIDEMKNEAYEKLYKAYKDK